MMMRRVAAGLAPPWLEPLLGTHFFSPCPAHADAARSERNMYCIDCAAAGAGAFCFYCRDEYHPGHRVIQPRSAAAGIQIRRSSYHDVVRAAEVQNVLDIGGVQTYVINSARVLFLNERPQPRGGGKGAASHACEVCARALLDPFRFCSLGCKLAGIKRNGDACFVLRESSAEAEAEAETAGGGERAEGLRERGGARRRGGSREGEGHDMRLPATPAPNSRRRKGVPHRSPLAS